MRVALTKKISSCGFFAFVSPTCTKRVCFDLAQERVHHAGGDGAESTPFVDFTSYSVWCNERVDFVCSEAALRFEILSPLFFPRFSLFFSLTLRCALQEATVSPPLT